MDEDVAAVFAICIEDRTKARIENVVFTGAR